MSPDQITRWRDELAERVAIMEYEGVVGATEKALADIRKQQAYERDKQGEMFRETR